MAKRVLVVDDEKLIVKGIRFSLEQDGMEVDCAYDGEEALRMAREKEYDIILLDVMLPKLDGFEVCQQLRETSGVPVVMLTAKGDDMDKILGLEYGADDYITKPFNILEVKARIKAIMRRTEKKSAQQTQNRVVQAGDLVMDCEARRVVIAGKEVNLMFWSFCSSIQTKYTAAKICSTLSGVMNIREMYVPWMYISGDCVKRLRPIQVIRNTFTPNGALVTIFSIKR